MGDIVIVKATQHVEYRISFADVCEELVAETLALRRAFDQSGDIDDFDSRRDNAFGVAHLDELVQTVVRNSNNANIRFDGAEREICRLRLGVAEAVEESGFADVRETDDPAFESHIIYVYNLRQKRHEPRLMPCKIRHKNENRQ